MHTKMTKLEKDILEWIAAHCDDKALATQCCMATVVSREHTGVGVYVNLELPDSAPACDIVRSPMHPYIESPQLEAGGGCVLFLENGRVSTLELYAYGDSFPDEMEEYSLHEPKDA